MSTTARQEAPASEDVWVDNSLVQDKEAPLEKGGAELIGNQIDAHLTVKEAFRYYWKAIFWSFLISNATIMESYDLILNGLLIAFPAFQESFGQQLPDGSWSIDSRWQVALQMSNNIGLGIGVILNGWLSDRWAPRHLMITAHFLVVAFVFVQFFAKRIEVLFVGTLLLAIPCGFFVPATSAYAAELCPTKLRGYMTTYVNLGWVSGHLIAAGVCQGLLKLDGEWSWRIVYAVQWAWPVPLAIACWFAPESPWWLARKGRIDDARRSLERLCSAPREVINPDDTLAMIEGTLRLEREEMQIQGGYVDCFKDTNLRRTEIAIVSWGGQILPGFVIQNYATYFFRMAGLSASDSFKITLGSYSIAFVGTVLSMFLQPHVGRRTVYFSGLCVMAPLMFIIGFVDLAPQNNATLWAKPSILLVWFFMYSLTIGPVPFTIGAEVGAARLRLKTISLARTSYYVLNIINTVVAPYMLNPTEGNLKGKAAFLPGALGVGMIIWTWFRLPETKDITPGALDRLFESRTHTRKFVEEAKKYQ